MAVDEGFWTPRNVVSLTIAVTFSLMAIFCLFALKNYAPLQFECRRCGRGFRRAPYRRMARRCPHCKATDWSAPDRVS